MAWPQAPAPQPAAAPGRSSTNSLTPALTVVGGVLTFLFSFVRIFRVDAIDAGWSVWTTGFTPGLFGVGTWIPIFALVAAGIALARMLVVGLDDKEVLGFRPAQLQLVAVAFAVLLWVGYVVSIVFSDTDGAGDFQFGLGIPLLFLGLAITTAGTVLGLMPTAASASGSSLGAPVPPPAGQWQPAPDAASAAWVAPAGVDPGRPAGSTVDPVPPAATWEPPPFVPPAAPSWTPGASPAEPAAPGTWDPATPAIPPAAPAQPWEQPPAPASPPAWDQPSRWSAEPPAPPQPSWEPPEPAGAQPPRDQPWPSPPSPTQSWEQPPATTSQPWDPPPPELPAEPQPWEPSSAVPPQPWAPPAPDPPADQWTPTAEPGPDAADPAFPATDGTPPPAPSAGGGVLYDPGTQVIPGPPPAPAPDDLPREGEPPPPA